MQKVLITAGAAGIGREFARAFTANGAKVFVCDIDDKALGEIAKEIPGVKLGLRADYAPPAQSTRAPNDYLDESEYDRVVDYSRNLGLNLI